MKYKLSDICDYVTGKVDVASLTASTYISTENILPNKAGIVDAASLPTTPLTQVFKKGDVLVSNIRPYFKKIWQAEFDGGCSNDVLVFRAKDDHSIEFLYYVLANDVFFEYSMATSKGTKMPRGDKKAIMEYEVPAYSKETQMRIASILRSIDNKITLNSKINNNLLAQVSSTYDYTFVENENSEWQIVTLDDIAEVSSGKRPPMRSNTATKEASVPLVGAASIMGYTSEANHADKILVTGRVGTHGVVQRFNTPCWTSDNTLIITSDYYEYVYQILQRIDYHSMNRGSTQPLITQGDMNKVEIRLPDGKTLDEFEEFAAILMQQYEANLIENAKLAQIRDCILPKLMSGEIDVSNIRL